MLPGMLYFVSIRMVPLVPRGPVGKVYRDVTEVQKTHFGFKRKSSGRGLNSFQSIAPATAPALCYLQEKLSLSDRARYIQHDFTIPTCAIGTTPARFQYDSNTIPTRFQHDTVRQLTITGDANGLPIVARARIARARSRVSLPL